MARPGWRPAKPPNAERDPERLGSSLDKIARRLGSPSADALSGVFGRWEELVGPGIAAHAKPVSLRRGVLLVEVDSNAWATQLRYMVSDVAARCCEVLGEDAVGRIDIRVGR